MSSYGVFGLFSRSFKLDSTPPSEVQAIFDKYSAKGFMGTEKLQKFLVEVQGEAQATKTDAEHLIELHLSEDKANSNKLRPQGLSLDAFLDYLLSTSNAPYHRVVHHDMTRPFSHYFIYTGHNSYLTGNQLSSDCSEKPIIDALLRGVRVIELDIWPTPSKDNIHVLHGRTLTSPVDFVKCIEAIKDHAFVASEFSVIVTLEDHLTSTLQTLAAKIITEKLGSILYRPQENESFKEFPSPQSLKRRIIISTKPPKEYLAGKSQKASESTEEATATKEETWRDEHLSHIKKMGTPANEPPSSVAPVSAYEDSDSGSDIEASKDEQVAPEYKQIITIRSGKPKKGELKDALAVEGEEVKRLSLSEPQLRKVAKECPIDLIRFTQRHILRVYPYGLRFDSSNYKPLLAWAHGAQMVALNMQGYGKPLWIVQGFFRANGGCGYVKKPEYLLAKEKIFDPLEKQPVKYCLKVTACMGIGWLERFGPKKFDKFSPPDFYARIGIAGVEADNIMKKTKVMEDKWIPKWNEEFEFPLTVPELAVLRIEVLEHNVSTNDFAGQTCLPVSELKTGFRSIPLHDKKGDELEGVRLLLRFQFT